MSHQFQLDPRAALEQRVLDVLEGKHGAYSLPEEARAILRVLRFHVGRERAIPLSDLADRVSAASVHAAGISEREVKQAVKTLVEEFGIPVGSRRYGAPPGYFLCVDADDFAVAIGPFVRQAVSELRRVRALGGSAILQEALGQIQLELGKEDDAA